MGIKITIICTAVLVSAVLLYMYFIFPSRKKRLPDSFVGRIIAHRGIHDDSDVGENSITAFRLAMEMGLPIELDVNLSADGVPMVVHDGNLSRLCGVDKHVRQLSADELSHLTLTKGGEHIPTLTEVLRYVDGAVPLLIELKGTDTAPVAARVAELLSSYMGDVAVQSFNPYHLMRFRRLMPRVPLGFLSENRVTKGLRGLPFATLSRSMCFNFLFRPDFISYRYSDRLTLSVRLCLMLGIKVFGWTVRGGEEITKYRNCFDSLICEGMSDSVMY